MRWEDQRRGTGLRLRKTRLAIGCRATFRRSAGRLDSEDVGSFRDAGMLRPSLPGFLLAYHADDLIFAESVFRIVLG